MSTALTVIETGQREGSSLVSGAGQTGRREEVRDIVREHRETLEGSETGGNI